MQLEELIERLQELRAAIGADVPVRISTIGRHLIDVDYVRCIHVGKADPYRTVSRGGTPIVMISE